MTDKETKVIKIADIKIGERKRQVDAKRVELLKKSIQSVGLINPITVNSKLELIAGNHRVEALKALGQTEILAIVTDVDKIQAEMIEIDENLIRKELTKLERSEHLKQRKKLYEQLHPESTKEAIAKKNLAKRKNSVLGEEDGKPVKTFVEDTAEQTGMSKRSIQQSIQNANNITPEAKEKLKGTPLADKTTFLTSLAKTAQDKQLETIEKELEKLNKSKREKAENKTEKVTVQAEPVSVADSQTSEKELDIAYKVDFVCRKVVVDEKWLDLPSEYDMDGNSYNNMMLVARNYLTTKKNTDKQRET